MTENNIICPGCKLSLAYQQLAPSERYNASGECLDLFNQLADRTFAFQHPDFHHQLSVDAYGAQHAGGVTRNVIIVYALIGLYLALEKNYTGRQVQHVHSVIPRQAWEKLEAPATTGALTVQDVLKATTEEELYAAMKKWAQAVWDSWSAHHAFIKEKTAHYI